MKTKNKKQNQSKRNNKIKTKQNNKSKTYKNSIKNKTNKNIYNKTNKKINKLKGGSRLSKILRKIKTHMQTLNIFTPKLNPYIPDDNNNDKILNLNIEFIKKAINYKNLQSNNNNSKNKLFDDYVKDLNLTNELFKSLINNNYKEGLKALKNLKDIRDKAQQVNTTQQVNTIQHVVIDLHGGINENIFKLPENINIIFLTSIDYLNCMNIKKDYKLDDYLQNPSCITDLNLKKLYKQAVIYYGGQYCINLNLARSSDVNEYATGIHFINDNKTTQNNAKLGSISKYNLGSYNDILSNLINEFNKKDKSKTYNLLFTSCRGFSTKNNEAIKFYEIITKLLNFKIYNNTDSLETSLLKYKECAGGDNIIYHSSNHSTKIQLQKYNDNESKSHLMSRNKTIINGKTTITYMGKIITLDELKTFKELKIFNIDNTIFLELFYSLKTDLHFNSISDKLIDTFFIIKYIFENNYDLCFKFLIYMFDNLKIYDYSKNKTYLDEKITQDITFFKLGMKIIPDLQSVKTIELDFPIKKKNYIGAYLKLIKTLKQFFSNNNIGDEGAKAIAGALANNTTLQNINISKNDIGVEGAKAIAEALANNTTLIELNIGINNILDEGAEAIAEALKSNNKLLALYISENNLTYKSAYEFAIILKKIKTLKIFDISKNKIDGDGAKAIANAFTPSPILEYNTTLEELSIGTANIGDTGVIAIVKALKNNISLKTLIIDDNNITDEGAIAIAALLNKNTNSTTTLRFININDNKIGIVGAKAITDSLKDNTTLKKLFFCNNNIGVEGAKAIANALTINKSLEILYLEDNNFDDKGIIALTDSLKNNINTKLNTFTVSKIGIEGAKAIAAVLVSNTTLKALKIGDETFGDDVAIIIAKALESNNTLEQLYISRNKNDKITDVGAQSFLNALKTNTKLKILEISNNIINGSILAEINTLLERNKSKASNVSNVPNASNASNA
jgi:Ran GTPase-activating protein (RanGAP) involved in mRNA processing and transport